MSRSLWAVVVLASLVLVGCSSAAPESIDSTEPTASSAPVTRPSASVSPTPLPSITASARPTIPAPLPTGTPGPTAPEEQVLAMWARGGLPPSMVAAARALPGVTGVGFRRRGSVGLVGVTRADGVEVLRLVDGWRVDLRAIAIDPVAWGNLLQADVALAELVPGTVVLGESSARFRGVGVGATFDLAGLVGLRVVAVVPDALVGSHEIVLHARDGDALEFSTDGVLVIRHDRGSKDAIEADLLRLVPDGRPSQVIDPSLGVRAPPLVLPTLRIKEQFGEFAHRPRDGVREIDIDPAWVSANIVRGDVPILGSVICHREIMDDLMRALQTVVDLGLQGHVVASQYAGCSYARRTSTAPDAALSRHSWGIALDINVDLSQPGGGAPLPPQVIDAFRSNGFRWGGDFLVPDNHHFEWVGTTAFAG